MRNICLVNFDQGGYILFNFDQGGYILFTNLLTVQSQKPDIKPVFNMGNTDNGNWNESAIDTLTIIMSISSKYIVIFKKWFSM